MDLLERARAIAACSLFCELAPAVVVRLAERARAVTLVAGERQTTDAHVWIVTGGALAVIARGHTTAGSDATASLMRRHGGRACAGQVVGLIRVIAPDTPGVDAIAEQPSEVLALAHDDIRDILEEDPSALPALASALARLLLEDQPR